MALVGVTVLDLTLEVVQPADDLQRLVSDRALVIGPQLVELTPRVRHAAYLGHAHLEAGLVAREVVRHQLALPALGAG